MKRVRVCWLEAEDSSDLGDALEISVDRLKSAT